MKGSTMTSWSEVSPGVQRPDSDASVVSAMFCASSAQAMDSENTTTPREMSAQFGSLRRAMRNTDDIA